MKMKNWLAHVVATGALALGSQAAQAAIICQGCEYGDDVGTYLGSYNPTTFDFGTFNHSDVGIDVGSNTAFEDFWVFDLDPGGSGSISAYGSNLLASRRYLSMKVSFAGLRPDIG
jgi:hypothetical protein